MSYEAFRHFADSWGLLFMVLVWIGFALWAFRPGAKQHHEDAANMIFDESENDG
ncbi:cbb3-type cytochrome c oxidase subunit 3 [Parasphingopyxis lamellibrachiae]|uniref:Cytochrome c oxidase cbb3-type subunit 4 n=1 Tax=Parasphingopyxis lamellibrachiae TaxID=680125 RepID=A0A3D9FET6_9SPHN|nr:cbb3-type cytochrome c oxidase subunit 3 [Parasphingopyxis lamellibrachiae]RED16299.1 cytochrome c oxidase cbb3-type subunit 4 [Parasphingopyxis lamellibrachiae]